MSESVGASDSRRDSAVFGRNVRQAREQRDWSQSELARRMKSRGWPKYSQVAVSRTEEGSRVVRLDEALDLAEVLGESLGYLLQDREDSAEQRAAKSTIRRAVDLLKEVSRAHGRAEEACAAVRQIPGDVFESLPVDWRHLGRSARPGPSEWVATEARSRAIRERQELEDHETASADGDLGGERG